MSVENTQKESQKGKQEIREKQSEKPVVSEKASLLQRYNNKFLEKVIFNNKNTKIIKLLSFLSCFLITATFFLNYKAFVKYAGNEVYFKSSYYEIPIENQLPSMFFSEQFQVNFFTFDLPYIQSYKNFVEKVSAPGKWVDYDSKQQYDRCMEKTCFISTYGEADGIPFKIFSIGMTIFSVVFLVVLEIRANLVYGMYTQFFAKMEQKYEGAEKELAVFRREKTIYGFLLIAIRLSIPVAIACINIMAHLPFHKFFITHTGSASFITVSMGIFFIFDGIMMNYTQKRIVAELRHQNVLENIKNRSPLYRFINSSAGVKFYWAFFFVVVFNCIGFVFNFTHQSVHEYLFITPPVYLQLVYVWHYDYYKEIIKQVKEL